MAATGFDGMERENNEERHDLLMQKTSGYENDFKFFSTS